MGELLPCFIFRRLNVIVLLLISAGVGRTGAFIALDCLLDQADAEGVVDVYALTNQMRKDRINMIQTVVSIHRVLRQFSL